MSPEQQRRRHNTRFRKAFGKCRVSWLSDIAYVRPLGREYASHTFWVHRKGRDWVLEMSTSDITFKDPNLKPLADQVKLLALLHL